MSIRVLNDSEAQNSEDTWPIPQQLRRQLLAALLEKADQPLREMSYEEFLDWADEDTLAEWVDGKVIMTSPASNKHQQLVSFLDQLVGLYVRYRRAGELRVAPFQMRLANSGREPDLLFVNTAHLDRLLRTYLDGPADLVVEIISPESIGRDRGDKFFEYEEAGIPEFWLLDPQTQRAEFYQLNSAGRYQPIQPVDGIYHSAVIPDFWLREEWLWQDPLPLPLKLLAEIAGMDAALLDQFENALRSKSA
ncbi:MAG: Uma2 family endonuclease [Caldilineaceae bacterium]|nr:Uma2 family endonuclease [Caldilineaceae bacterium]